MHLPPMPTPLSGTSCGLPAPLCLIFNAALRVPDAVGLNRMTTWQIAPAANEDLQLFV